MMVDFHFLRPWWLLTLIFLTVLATVLWRQKPRLQAWSEVCDPHLLDHLLQKKGNGKRMASLSCLFASIFFMIVAIAGPTWYKLPVVTYKSVQPRVLVLDMSDTMLTKDLSPDRLTRAKFKLHDLLAQKDVGQFALVVYTGEPFVVSPLTDDGQTIASLLSTLTPDIMPVTGQKLDSALSEASNLITQAGYQQGQILVLTANTPSAEAMETAKQLAGKGISSSIMPVKADTNLNPLYERFANSGKGLLIPYSADSSDLAQWINASRNIKNYELNDEDDIPIWRDEGRWFLIPALLLLLPLFQRGWLQRVAV